MNSPWRLLATVLFLHHIQRGPHDHSTAHPWGDFDANEIINDIRYLQTTDARDAAFENIKLICGRLLSFGIRPILSTVLPVRNDETGFAAVTALMLDLNDKIRTFASSTPDIIFVDGFAALVDNIQTDNRAQSAALADTVHLNAIGAYMLAVAAAAAVRPFAPAPKPPVASSGDNRVANPASSNHLNNPLFIRSGGIHNGTGGSPNVPDWWAVNVTGSVTATPTIEPRTLAADGDTNGNNLKVVMAATAAGAEVSVRTMQTINDFATFDEAFADFALRMADTVNLQYVFAQFYMSVGGRLYQAYWNGGINGLPSAQIAAAPFKGVIRSISFPIPPGAQVSAVIAITYRFAGAGGMTT